MKRMMILTEKWIKSKAKVSLGSCYVGGVGMSPGVLRPSPLVMVPRYISMKAIGREIV